LPISSEPSKYCSARSKPYISSIALATPCRPEEERYPSDYTDEELRAQVHELESAVTIPVNVDIMADYRVFDIGEAKRF
jgi:hypothetical protein